MGEKKKHEQISRFKIEKSDFIIVIIKLIGIIMLKTYLKIVNGKIQLLRDNCRNQKMINSMRKGKSIKK
jgi:hypothetical protein